MESDINSKTVNIEKILETECLHCHQAIDVSDLATFDDIECPHCGKHMQVPGKLGNFTLLNIMGKGGMGSVYCARDEVLGRLVAIKVILPSLAEDKEFISSFKREAQAAAKVNHPHIAQIYAFGEENGQPYIVMELVTGRGLDQLVESGKVLDQGLIMQIGMDIAEGLSEADDMGLIHGDIKPENILLDEKMNGKLIDFGISSVGGVDAADGIWGTPYYIAPEKLRREKVDARSDIYCLGATLYHALAGVPPFDGETPVEVVKARLEIEPIPLREIRSDITEEIENIIIRMLKMERSQRYPTYTSLLSDMRKVVDEMQPKKKIEKSKKIVIKKRGGIVGASSTGQIKPLSSKIKAVDVPVPVALSAEEKNNRKKILLKIFWVLFTIFVIIAVSVGGVFFKLKKDKEIRMRRAEYNLKETVIEIDKENTIIQQSLSNIVKQAAVTVNIKDQVVSISSSVTEISPADLHVSLVPPAPEIKPVVAPDDQDVDGADSNNVPENVDKAVSNDAPADVEGELVPDDEQNVGEPEIEINDPPVVVLAKKAFVRIGKIDKMVVAARKVGAESEQLTAESRKYRSKNDMTLVLNGMEDKQIQLVSIKDKINKELKKIDAVIVEMETIRGNMDEQRAEALQAKLAAEKQARDEEKREQLLAAHEADVASDLAQIDGSDAAVKKAMKIHLYDDVIDDLNKKKKQLKTDEGKAAISIYIDRAVYMRDLKKFLIKQLNKDPFKWGYIDGGSPEDIIKATPKRIILKGRSVLWNDVSTKQFFHLIKHYVTDMNKSVKLVELGKQSMGVAVFCYEHEAYEPAERYAYKAVEMNPRLAKDAERLFPEEVEDEFEDQE